MDIVKILGIDFDNVTLSESVDYALNSIENREKIMVVTPNSEIAYMCRENSELLSIINHAHLVLPDGIGVVYASKILKTPLKQKVAGVEFCEKLIEKMAKENMSLFILGGKPGVAELACKNLSEKYNGLRIAGFSDGYFENDEEVIAKINDSLADLLLVCLGAPRQEKFMDKNFHKISSRVMCGAGGSVDVFSGNVKRAPKIFISLGLEWFYRLLKEPKRFVRMLSLPKFLLIIIGQRIFKK